MCQLLLCICNHINDDLDEYYNDNDDVVDDTMIVMMMIMMLLIIDLKYHNYLHIF